MGQWNSSDQSFTILNVDGSCLALGDIVLAGFGGLLRHTSGA
jgi:hypothetical protein